MATNRLRQALEQLQQTLAPSAEDLLTDAQLLARFVAGRDEAAFAALVRRHGPMVLGVCRRLLRNPHDADDAFQATFLVLVRKAASVRKREAVGSWLYGVAYRTAREARATQARRRAREVQVDVMPHPEVAPEEAQDWRPLLDRELVALPEKYRAPLLLCDLAGKGRKEVARELGLPEGTLSSRLATARQMLARRLTRYGLALSGGALAALLSETKTPACVPAALFLSTTRAALLVAAGHLPLAGVVSAKVAALTEGVLKTMFLLKLKSTAVMLFGVAAVGLATGGVFYQTQAGASDAQPGGRALAQARAADREGDVKKKDLRRAADEAEVERALRAELEAARREAEALKAEADKQRQRAEDALRQAQAQLEQARVAEQSARQEAEKARYTGALRQAQRGQQGAKKSVPQEPAHLDADLKAALAELENIQEKRQEIRRRQFEEERRALEGRLKSLAAEMAEQEKQEAMEIDRRRADLLNQQRTKALDQKRPTQPGQGPAGGDKLDRILERLERLEQRLDRIERSKR